MSDSTNQGRRVFLTGALAGAATGIVGSATAGVLRNRGTSTDGPSVHTRKRVQWQLASSFPKSLDALYGGADVLAARVASLTDGAFTIRCYQAGELVPALQVMDAVEKATVEIGHTGGYYYTGKHPALAFDTTVPFGLTPRQQTAWLTQAGGRELVDEIYADFGIRSFVGGNTGAQMGGWFREPIESLADLKGLRMRIPGMGGKVMDALGVSVQVIGGGDIYPALERGAIDATEWVGPYDDEKLGFHEIAKYYMYPGWWEPGPNLSMLVNQRAYDALPSDYKAALEVAITESGQTMQATYDAKNPAALQRLLAPEHGVTMLPFSEDVMVAAREAAEQMYVDEAAKDPRYRKVFEHWRTFRKESFRWFGTAELAYAKFAWRV